MDPRLEALHEVRNLLEQEGWSVPDPRSATSTFETRPSRPAHAGLITKVVCAFSIFLNFLLVAALHDIQGRTIGTRASLELVGLSFQAPEFKTVVYLTIDGTEVWRRSPGPAGSVKLDFDKTKPVEFDSRCIVELWRKSQSDDPGKPVLIARSFVTADRAGGGPFELDLRADDGSFYRWKARVTEIRSSFAR